MAVIHAIDVILPPTAYRGCRVGLRLTIGSVGRRFEGRLDMLPPQRLQAARLRLPTALFARASYPPTTHPLQSEKSGEIRALVSYKSGGKRPLSTAYPQPLRCMGPEVPQRFTSPLRSYCARAVFSSRLKLGARSEIPEFLAERGPYSVACFGLPNGYSPASYRRWISILLKRSSPTCKPCAEGSGCAQVLNGVTNGLSRRCEPPILGAATLRGLGEEQFSRSVIIEGRHASTLAQKVMHYEVHSLWLPAREVR